MIEINFKSVVLVLATAAAVMFGGATSHVVAQDKSAAQAIEESETPANELSTLMWRINSTGGDFTILGPAMNQLFFEGDDCNNSVNLMDEFPFNVSYTYSDGVSLHSGNTANPEDAHTLQFVCWVVMAQEPYF